MDSLKFYHFLERKRKQYGAKKFDASNLNMSFVRYYNTGQRIEVEFGYGEKKRGRIGVTTGRKPSFMLLLTTRSMGSSYLIGPNDKVVKIISN